MKIYTRTGDGGRTSLFGGGKVSKSSRRIAAYGAVDELNSALGAVRASGPAGGIDGRIDAFLERSQNDLFRLGGELASASGLPANLRPVGAEDAAWIEREIDAMEEGLEPLRNFILPGGTPAAAAAHLARAVCRRAEREVVGLSEEEAVRGEVIVYLNRLGDALFVAARAINRGAGGAETIWKGGGGEK